MVAGRAGQLRVGAPMRAVEREGEEEGEVEVERRGDCGTHCVFRQAKGG
uniref:Uncharacterized protein n=1 Tax=Arundo donax TaxID=35708 RepID=A0A0A9AP57_ARUDO